MEQPTNGADPSAPSGNIVVQEQTRRRLESIQKPEESPDDTLTRILNDAIEHIPLEELLEELLTQFEDAASISVDVVPEFENPSMLLISVHTGSAEFEETVSLYEGQETRADIETKDGDRYELPFDITATCTGPKSEMMTTTPVFVTDTILGMDAVSLEDGISRLRQKIGKTRNEIRQILERSRIDQSR